MMEEIGNIEKFEEYLKDQNLAVNTITSYLYAIRQFYSLYDTLTRKNLREYKLFLMKTYKPQTVNLRIRAINCYLESLQKEKWKLNSVKVQQKPFLENVISEADYLYFKNCLKRDGEIYWYLVVRFLAATGARVSELVQIKSEHVEIGYLDLYSKGGKLRRIYIPSALQKETLNWMHETKKDSGFLFVNRKGEQITSRGIASQLKHFAVRYGLDPAVVYPHSFRHRFAKSFLERYNDLAMLADLMGHESIETTRIYLRKTSTEQRNIVNKVIDW
ncbi:tyrosine-type recombinase/integrase [Brotaphodocola catenula]|uniref:tyrosine-type recombinase/integrase n=1 Tax=Brotaphodocola catenula TaxID=2885361 RepID=UPI0027E48B15|nr:tyrosine-type recombinase/integrase [Brotaphodocola catenula]